MRSCGDIPNTDDVLCPPTRAQFLWRDSDAHAGRGGGRSGLRQQVTSRQLQLHEDHGVGASHRVFQAAQVLFQGLALVPAELPLPGDPGGLVTQGEDVEAERANGELGALVRHLRRGADHGESSCNRGGLAWYHRATAWPASPARPLTCNPVFTLPLHLRRLHVDALVADETSTGDAPVRLAEPFVT